MKLLKFILLPFSILYGLGAALRNIAYDKGWRKSFSFELPIINVGNLAVGGTGKTPHIEYLTELLQEHYHVAILSRGYRRKTRGFVMGTAQSTAAEVGDEPAQYLKKFPKAAVAVGEDRVFAIPLLLAEAPQTQLLLLDDAFQHRPVQPGLNILLTEYHNLYSQDTPLPDGRLREFRSGAKRADIIIVTKCPSQLSDETCSQVIKQLQPLPHQDIFFSTIEYGSLKPLGSENGTATVDKETSLLLVTGIANPKPIKNYLNTQAKSVTHLPFPDHHSFSPTDLSKIKQSFEALSGTNKLLVTTEKDAMRLPQELAQQIPVFYLPIKVKLINDPNRSFDQKIVQYVQQSIADLEKDHATDNRPIGDS